jgi:hypothetical protein
MKRIHMLRTRKTASEVLREGKPYSVPTALADELIAAGDAVDMDKPQPERAVAGPTEDGARVSKRPATQRKTTRQKKAAADE